MSTLVVRVFQESKKEILFIYLYQAYTALRIGLLRSRSPRERLRIVTRFLDALEEDYQAAYGSEGSGKTAPFAEGCEEALERLMSVFQ